MSFIVDYLRKNGPVSGNDIAIALGITRQAVNKYLKRLISEGEVVKIGKTKGARYLLKTGKREEVKKQYTLEGLEEDKVFEELSLLMGLRRNLAGNVFDIVQYAFSEMLNNAIDHSRSSRCEVEMVLDNYDCSFRVKDFGVGIFFNIQKKFGLSSETQAILELTKGKRTTYEEKHTGEGVFFTSKAGDVIKFRSHEASVIFDNLKEDVFVRENVPIGGTEVTFTVSRQSRRVLQDVFEKYSGEEFEYGFEKTVVSVELIKERYISRSEARRMLSGLEKFTEIVLDFKGVKTMGQGFADEIFRVFKNAHRGIRIKTENVSPLLEAMIKHVSEAR